MRHSTKMLAFRSTEVNNIEYKHSQSPLANNKDKVLNWKKLIYLNDLFKWNPSGWWLGTLALFEIVLFLIWYSFYLIFEITKLQLHLTQWNLRTTILSGIHVIHNKQYITSHSTVSLPVHRFLCDRYHLKGQKKNVISQAAILLAEWITKCCWQEHTGVRDCASSKSVRKDNQACA